MANERKDPAEQFKRHEYELWREREKKDLEVERNRGERPLEGFSGEDAGTTWTDEQDDSAAAEVHAHDRDDSLRESEEQIPPADPAERPERQ